MATRACSLFDKAAPGSPQSSRQYLRGAKLMRRAAVVVGRAGSHGRLGQTCTTDLVARLMDARDRADRQGRVR
jgi:hypothetical protein